jgi:hypothetical protein
LKQVIKIGPFRRAYQANNPLEILQMLMDKPGIATFFKKEVIEAAAMSDPGYLKALRETK